MSKLWVKLGDYDAVKVSAEIGANINDFIKEVKKELQIVNPPQEISLSLTKEGIAIKPGLKLCDLTSGENYPGSDDDHPLFIKVRTSRQGNIFL
jgi:hypothetical protein